MFKIVIVGDSWSAGTWKTESLGTIELDQPGLQPLSKNFNVVNLSRGGSSNWQSLNTIKNYFDSVDEVTNENTLVLLCQTDLYRDKMSELFDVEYLKLYKDSADIETFYKSAAEMFYYKLDNISNAINKKIYLIGGLTDVDYNLLTSITNNAKIITNSWIGLFDNTHVESLIPLVIDKNFLPKAKSYGRMDLAINGAEHSDKNFNRFMNLQETKFMSSFIGDFHPTIEGHNVMATHILNYFGETNA
jgi:hypothetical protein